LPLLKFQPSYNINRWFI